MLKIITEVNNEFTMRINEERTKDEFNQYLRDSIIAGYPLPDFPDIFLSQIKSNTYRAKVIRVETNVEQDLNVYIDISFKTEQYEDFVYGFVEGDLFTVKDFVIANNLATTVARKLIFIDINNVPLEVRGVSPSLVTESENTFMFKHDGEDAYLYWYNQYYSCVGTLCFTKEKDLFRHGSISLNNTLDLPQASFPILYKWVENNPDNILKINPTEKTIIFPKSKAGAFLQIKNSGFALDEGSKTIPKDTHPQASNYFVADEGRYSVGFNEDISGNNLTILSPTAIARVEKITLTKTKKNSTRFENSLGMNIMIKAV